MCPTPKAKLSTFPNFEEMHVEWIVVHYQKSLHVMRAGMENSSSWKGSPGLHPQCVQGTVISFAGANLLHWYCAGWEGAGWSDIMWGGGACHIMWGAQCEVKVVGRGSRRLLHPTLSSTMDDGSSPLMNFHMFVFLHASLFPFTRLSLLVKWSCSFHIHSLWLPHAFPVSNGQGQDYTKYFLKNQIPSYGHIFK